MNFIVARLLTKTKCVVFLIYVDSQNYSDILHLLGKNYFECILIMLRHFKHDEIVMHFKGSLKMFFAECGMQSTYYSFTWWDKRSPA